MNIVELLRSYYIPFGQEAMMQATVEQILREHEIQFERECVLSTGSRIEFLISDGTGIECKVDGSAAAVLRQCLRYAECPQITSLILLTTRSTHRFAVDSLLDKPFHVILVSGI